MQKAPSHLVEPIIISEFSPIIIFSIFEVYYLEILTHKNSAIFTKNQSRWDKAMVQKSELSMLFYFLPKHSGGHSGAPSKINTCKTQPKQNKHPKGKCSQKTKLTKCVQKDIHSASVCMNSMQHCGGTFWLLSVVRERFQTAIRNSNLPESSSVPT